MDVYDKFQYDPEQYNLSRNEAMMNFYVIDQNGVRHKNMDAIFLLYWHSSKSLQTRPLVQDLFISLGLTSIKQS